MYMGLMLIKSVDVKVFFRWCGVEICRRVPAQVSFSSSDHGLKFRGPYQITCLALKLDFNLTRLDTIDSTGILRAVALRQGRKEYCSPGRLGKTAKTK
ncbi:hypothetical protein AVEN_45371-1 [Araneus ventricosus]|uniref:Uncharacterized protein n=1 Tax=Araneus ventricosus TaxID=182803 RepID=A0A4Y2M9L4_ARAVE|nr:hypothetical protein AVEN_45371-1 [Araneus ventricosus]